MALPHARLIRRAALAFALAPSLLRAAGAKAEPIVFVADSRRYEGWLAWFINLYNESLAWFTLVTVFTIPIVGVLLGLVTDLVMARTGINLRSRTMGDH